MSGTTARSGPGPRAAGAPGRRHGGRRYRLRQLSPRPGGSGDDGCMSDAWSARAGAYRESPTHREGDDLDALVAWCEPGPDVEALDVATGGGHVARRLAQAGCRVTTCDAAQGMRPDVVCPAEQLPFPDGSFDVVACRIAAHHFIDVAAAVREMARVTRRLVVVEDTLLRRRPGR